MSTRGLSATSLQLMEVTQGLALDAPTVVSPLSSQALCFLGQQVITEAPQLVAGLVARKLRC